jgi:hypothetical protein
MGNMNSGELLVTNLRFSKSVLVFAVCSLKRVEIMDKLMTDVGRHKTDLCRIFLVFNKVTIVFSK